MLFNSVDFAIFLPIVFFLYWFAVGRSIKLQNWLILISSFVFYGWWDWRFLSLLVFSSVVDYVVGLAIQASQAQHRKKILLMVSIFMNLGLLAVFKYFNFFAESFVDAFTFFGSTIDYDPLNIVLPVGISFYTFQTLSYGIDVYRGKLTPTRDVVAFFAFVSFFPQLVAGPIERATNLLPQFFKKREFDYALAVNGCRQILWGLFKKIVIADNCAEQVNLIFANYTSYSGSTLLLGAILFAFQIYGDFSGYSDIAVGVARLFGFELMRNFAFPYFSRDVAEFWRRWHISLSTWFRDYVYFPLGGSQGSRWETIRNTFIVFLVSGFWHGANWTFLAWGALHAIFFLPLLLSRSNRANLDTVAAGRLLPTLREAIAMLVTFLSVVLSWILFRAESISQALDYIRRIFVSLFSRPELISSNVLFFIAFFLVVEWLGREQLYAIEKPRSSWRVVRWGFYYMLVWTIILYGGKGQEFIYFQF
jgi:alginate O-acetyltransferase complex protein AlgI